MDDHEKLAKAYHELGQIQAKGFLEGLQKEASNESSPVAQRLRQRFGVDKEAAGAGMLDDALSAARNYGSNLKQMGDDAFSAAKSQAQSARNAASQGGKSLQESAEQAKDTVTRRLGTVDGSASSSPQEQIRNRILGAGGAGLAAGGAAGAGGAAAAMGGEDKEGSADEGNPMLTRL